MAFAELPLADTLARPVRDLRISVTDRCQFRCTYCMPREMFGRDFVFLPRGPLLRRDLDKLVAMLAAIGGIGDIAMTTNGALLAAKARALKAAGLARVT